MKNTVNDINKRTINILSKKLPLLEESDMFSFKCKNCGGCCKKSNPPLSPFDAYKLSKHKNISLKEFLATYCEINIDQNNFTVTLKTNPECFFLKNNMCTVYEHRPFVCRIFPLGSSLINDKLEFYYYNQLPIHSKTKIKQNTKEFIESSLSKQDHENQKVWMKFKNNLSSQNLNKGEIVNIIQLLYRHDEEQIMNLIGAKQILDNKIETIINIIQKSWKVNKI